MKMSNEIMMNPKIAQQIKLSDEMKESCKRIKPVDIIVGVLCKDVEPTVLNVLNVVNEGLYQSFPDSKKAIVVSEGHSTDKTYEVLDLFQPYSTIEKIVTRDMTTGGKGAGVLTIFEIAHELDAKCVVLMDGDLLSIKPVWVQTIANPIIYGRADLTVPYYIRHKYDAVITNNLVYPFTRALYGLDIRQPIAGEFALSRNLYETLRSHPLFPLDFGIDIFIVTVAAAKEMKVKEGLYSLKIHGSTMSYLEPEKLLIPMFTKVTGMMFELASYYELYWKSRPHMINKSFYRKSYSKPPVPVKIDLEKLKYTFLTEYPTKKEAMSKLLPPDLMKDLDASIRANGVFDSELWSKTVYNYTAAYKYAKNSTEKTAVLDSLKTLWIGRYISFIEETENMNINESEAVLQKQATIFEKNINYLISIY
ncbi:MAG: glycosyltransferase [Methanobacteriota archaeon]